MDIAETLAEVSGVEHVIDCVYVNHRLERFHLQRIGKMIHDIVDLEASAEQGRTVIKRGIDEGLDANKDMYDSMEEALTTVAIELARGFPEDFKPKLNVVYFPQLGFHIALLQEEVGSGTTNVENSLNWERRFSTETHIYYKNDKMCELDHHLGDLYVEICDREIEIVYQLVQNVLQDELFLIKASDACGQLDCLLALTHGAQRHQLTRPIISEDNVIDIKGGRHVLQELTVPSYVPHDTFVKGGRSETGDDPSMIILTGPNYSGKSVYLKEVATIVYMAHIGSFVPADSATIGLTDKILTRITTCETVSRAQSTFVIDLQQAALALNHFTSRSLVVFDEFGKGTESCDGAGLVAGLIKYLSSVDEPPRTLLATHFHEILDSPAIQHCNRVRLAHMEVCIDKSASVPTPNQHEIVYLYNLRMGPSYLSFGTQCARLNGMPNVIVDRALQLADHMLAGEDLPTICSADKTEASELQEAEKTARDFLGWNLATADSLETLLLELVKVGNSSSDCTWSSLELVSDQTEH